MLDKISIIPRQDAYKTQIWSKLFGYNEYEAARLQPELKR